MKRRGTLVMTVLVVMAMLFASCSSGLSKDAEGEGGASTKTVSVSLGVAVEGTGAQKTISNNTDLSSLTYWYKANPNWTQDRPIHGDTGANFVLIPNYSVGAAPKNIGNFTAGDWTFYVEVRKGDAVIYSGDDTYTLYTGHTSPEITVTPDGTGTGTISISVKVPTTGASETLSVVAEPGGGVVMTRVGSAGGLTTFTGTKSSLTPGAYTLTFGYTDQGGAVTEGAAQAVTVFAGQTSNITGTIDGGKWHPTTITINSPGINYTSLLPASGHRTPNDPSAYTVTASATSAQGNEITYEWFLNGTSVQGPNTTATYDFTGNNYGLYDITCAAIDATAGVTAFKTIYVQVGYAVATPTSPITMGTDETVFAAGDIVPLNYTGTLTGLTVTGVAAANIEWDNAAHKASFIMPAQDVTSITGTFE